MIKLLTKEEWFERWEDELTRCYGKTEANSVRFFKWTDKQYEAWLEAAHENNAEERLAEYEAQD